MRARCLTLRCSEPGHRAIAGGNPLVRFRRTLGLGLSGLHTVPRKTRVQSPGANGDVISPGDRHQEDCWNDEVVAPDSAGGICHDPPGPASGPRRRPLARTGFDRKTRDRKIGEGSAGDRAFSFGHLSVPRFSVGLPGGSVPPTLTPGPSPAVLATTGCPAIPDQNGAVFRLPMRDRCPRVDLVGVERSGRWILGAGWAGKGKMMTAK